MVRAKLLNDARDPGGHCVNRVLKQNRASHEGWPVLFESGLGNDSQYAEQSVCLMVRTSGEEQCVSWAGRTAIAESNRPQAID